jgi:crotonobetainyl-CoA:carnitine CoA-transferase CaiB-like acyl-CoA transferase
MVSIHPGSKLMNYMYFGGISGHREGRRRREPYPFVYLPCKDGYMCFVTREGKHWKTFIEMVGDEELLHNPRYRDRRAMGAEYPEEVDARLIPWLKQRTSAELFEAFRKAGLPFVPQRTIDEVVNCPHLAARGYFQEVEHPIAGKLKYAGAPYKLSETPWKMANPAPTLGQHNEDILCGWLGYSKEELASMRSCEVI